MSFDFDGETRTVFYYYNICTTVSDRREKKVCWHQPRAFKSIKSNENVIFFKNGITMVRYGV